MSELYEYQRRPSPPSRRDSEAAELDRVREAARLRAHAMLLGRRSSAMMRTVEEREELARLGREEGSETIGRPESAPGGRDD